MKTFREIYSIEEKLREKENEYEFYKSNYKNFTEDFINKILFSKQIMNESDWRIIVNPDSIQMITNENQHPKLCKLVKQIEDKITFPDNISIYVEDNKLFLTFTGLMFALNYMMKFKELELNISSIEDYTFNRIKSYDKEIKLMEQNKNSLLKIAEKFKNSKLK